MLRISAFAHDAGFQIAWAIARRMGVVPRPGFELAFQAQVQREVGDAPDSLGRVTNNPLNLTAPRPDYWAGQTGWASGGSAVEHHTDFAVFATLAAGIEAAAQNYMSGYYAGVRDAIASGGDAVAVAAAISASPWSSDHYPQLADQVREIEGTQGGIENMNPQQIYDEIAPIIQDKVVAPQVDTNIALKEALAVVAHAVSTVQSPDPATYAAAITARVEANVIAAITGIVPPKPVGVPADARFVGEASDGSVTGWQYADGTTHYFKDGVETPKGG